MKYIVVIYLILLSCTTDKTQTNPKLNFSHTEQAKSSEQIANCKTIEECYILPKDFKRMEVVDTSFAYYLRSLPLKSEGALVKYFDGRTKQNNRVYSRVIDLEIGKKNLHQCADAIMRLHAEYLWERERYDKIHFNFTNGFQVNYTEWKQGRRMIVEGNKTYWNNRHQPSSSYSDFWQYMELIFTYAGTASLSKELISVEYADMQIGDILIQGGHPGHAVIVVDMAYKPETKEKIFLLAQSW